MITFIFPQRIIQDQKPQQNNIINNTSIDHNLGFIKFVTAFIFVTFSLRNVKNSFLFFVAAVVVVVVLFCFCFVVVFVV